MYASNSHSYTHLTLALGIVRESTPWVFITSQYPGIHDIGLPTRLKRVVAQLSSRVNLSGADSDVCAGNALEQRKANAEKDKERLASTVGGGLG